MSTNHDSPNHHTTLHSEASDGAHDAVTHRHHHKPTKAKPSVNLNVTSMVDILFNLLVYFIVTVNFTMDEGALKAKLPAEPGAMAVQKDPEEEDEKGEKREIVVKSTADGYGYELLFSGHRVPSFAELSAVLDSNNHEKVASGKLNPKVDILVIHPAGKVRWQHVVNAFNQAVRSGYSHISFADAN